MTSKAYCSKKAYFAKIMAIFKRQAWLIFLWFVALFFALPVPAALSIQQARSYATVNQNMQFNLEAFLSAAQAAILRICGRQSYSLTWVLLALAFMSALVFGAYMQRKKQVDFYHSQPVSRQNLLIQHMAAGFLAVLLPYLANLLLLLLVALFMGAITAIPFLSLLGAVALHTLYFSAIFLTVMLAMVICGNGAVAMIIGGFFLSVLPALLGLGLALADIFYPTFYGALYDWGLILRWLSPAAAYASLPINGLPHGVLPIIIFDIGLLFAILRLYAKRPSEGAGKAIVFKPAKPILKYCMAILLATVMAYIFYNIGRSNSGWFWWYFGGVCGAFLATQIMEIVYAYDFRAIRRHLRGLAIFLVVYLGLSTCAIHDISGFNTKTPPAEQVASAQIYLVGLNQYAYDRGGRYYGSAYNHSELQWELDALELNEEDYLEMGPVNSPEAIAAAVRLAEAFANHYQKVDNRQPQADPEKRAALAAAGKNYLLDYLDGNSNYMSPNSFSCKVVFTLENGRKLARDYYGVNSLPVQLMLMEIAAIYDAPDFAAAQLTQLNWADDHYLPESLQISELYYGTAPLPRLSMEQRGRLMAALRADSLELTVAQQCEQMPIGYLRLRQYALAADYSMLDDVADMRPYRFIYWPIYEEYSRTLGFFAELGYGRELWQPQLADVQSIIIHDYNDDKRVEYEKYAASGVPPMITSTGSYNMAVQSIAINSVGREITDPAEIAELFANSYPADVVEYNHFIDIQQGLELQVLYTGKDGQSYGQTRVIPY